MLGRVRNALAGGEADLFPLPPVFSIGAAWPPGSSQLIQQFTSEFEKVGGVIATAASSADVVTYVENLLPCGQPPSGELAEKRAVVAVSDRVFRVLTQLRGQLEQRKIGVLPSFREFVVSRKEPVTTSEGNNPDTDDHSGFGLYEAYKRELFEADLGVTTADFAIADTGTLVLVSGEKSGSSTHGGGGLKKSATPADGEQHRLMSLVPPVHVCLLDSSRILPDLASLLHTVHENRYSTDGSPLAMTFITGPSRTADIELSLTMGVHGPKQVHLLLFPMA